MLAGTTGLGRELVHRLAALHPALVVFTGRDEKRAEAVVNELKQSVPGVRVQFVRMDLASLSDCQRAITALKPSLNNRLDILICNAGIMAVPPKLSPDGYEIQWATNHLGHALLIKHMIPYLRSTADNHGDARVVSLTSEGLFLAPADEGIVFKDLKTTQDYGFGGRWKRYGQSKLANALYVAQLAKHEPAISSIAIHPGVVGTDLVKTLGFADRLLVYATSNVLKPEDGCKNALWGATADRKDFVNGGYYRPIAEPGKQTKWLKSEELAARLWSWTEDALRAYEVSG